MGFSRQEYWSELPFPPPGELPDPGIEPVSLASPALAGRFFTTSATQEVHYRLISYTKDFEEKLKKEFIISEKITIPFVLSRLSRVQLLKTP